MIRPSDRTRSRLQPLQTAVLGAKGLRMHRLTRTARSAVDQIVSPA